MKKEIKSYSIKSFSLDIKDIDSESRTVKAYAAAFNILDSDNDIIRPGAFAKSISERGPNSSSNRKIAHLRNHDWDQMIGNIKELNEDNYGLMFVSTLGRSTKGNDALLDYQDGILREHSIGFQYISDKLEYIEPEGDSIGYWNVTEVKLFENSAVTFGANEFTPVVDVAKGMEKAEAIKTINDEMNVLIKALKNGQGTDERLYQIEMKLKVIQQKYNSLINYEPVIKPLEDFNKPKDDEKDNIKSFYINLLKQK